MTRQRALLTLVKAMFAILVLGFLFILLRSLRSLTTSTGSVFDDVVFGQTALRRYQGERVWATRLNPELEKQAQRLVPHLVEPNSGCSASLTICALSAKTARDGIDIVFTKQVPAQLPESVPWYGGFVNPTNGAVYDRLGRAYKGTSTASKSLSVRPVD